MGRQDIEKLYGKLYWYCQTYWLQTDDFLWRKNFTSRGRGNNYL